MRRQKSFFGAREPSRSASDSEVALKWHSPVVVLLDF